MEPVKAGMKFGTLDSRLKEMQAHASKINGKVETYYSKGSSGIDLGFGLVDKNGKSLPGSLFITNLHGERHIVYNSLDDNSQYVGTGDTFTKVRARESEEWIIDENKNGVVDANELKNRRK